MRCGSAWRSTSRHTDLGDTLVEVLVTIVIIGIVVTALVGAIMSATRASTIHRSIANTESLAKTFLEQAEYEIEGASHPLYIDCASNYPIVWTTPPGYTGYTVSITKVEYWNPTPPNPNFSTGGCSTPEKNGIQEIVVTAYAPDGASSSIETAVYNPVYRACYLNASCS